MSNVETNVLNLPPHGPIISKEPVVSDNRDLKIGVYGKPLTG